MIKKISIRDVASYDSEGVIIDNLQKVNFIFGGNGMGKTTISRFLAGPDDRPTRIKDDEIRQVDGFSFGKDGSVDIIDEGLKDRYRTVEKRDFSVFKNCHLEREGYHEVKVYNQDFKKQNLTEVMPGVFSMGNDRMTRILRYQRVKSKIAHMARRGHDIASGLDYRNLDKFDNIDLEDVNRPYSVEPSVYTINNELERIGFTGFRLRTSSHNPYCYEIVRKGNKRAGETLSEGEITIVTFLYFLQLIEGIGKGGRKIVVIDDPISSLDYDAMCVVSELTDELMYYARSNRFVEQVIMLTHNTAFHQGLSVRQPKENTGYWKLYKRKGVSKVAAYGTENPVMGDYEQLWDDLRDVKKSVEQGRKWDVIGLPNLMRKIVETYFVDYGGYNRHKLFDGGYIKDPELKQEIITLMKWIDEGSHGLKDNLYAGCGEMMGERYMDALEVLFRAMGQEAHWKMMMREHD